MKKLMKKSMAVFVAVIMLFSAVSMVGAITLDDLPLDVTIYYKGNTLDPNTVKLAAWCPYLYEDDDMIQYGMWAGDFPAVTSDRDGYLKYHFTITGWGEGQDPATFTGIPTMVSGNNAANEWLALFTAEENPLKIDLDQFTDGKLVVSVEETDGIWTATYETGSKMVTTGGQDTTVTVVSDGTTSVETSEEASTPVDSSVPAAESSTATTSSAPATGDAGIAVAMTTLALAAGAVVLVKKVSK
ncbi:MAG TPA: hypothetical protein H9671_03580 [Firmicutes bacterium]|nr:hypothetical protein [Bacillota bacterium]